MTTGQAGKQAVMCLWCFTLWGKLFHQWQQSRAPLRRTQLRGARKPCSDTSPRVVLSFSLPLFISPSLLLPFSSSLSPSRAEPLWALPPSHEATRQQERGRARERERLSYASERHLCDSTKLKTQENMTADSNQRENTGKATDLHCTKKRTQTNASFTHCTSPRERQYCLRWE